MKKLLLPPPILLILLTLSAIPAQAYDFIHEDICYNIVSNTEKTVEVTHQSILANNNYTGHVIIPSQVTNNGTTYTVAGIGGQAFYQCYDLVRVVVPETVKYIGEQAFYNTTGLWRVELSEGLQKIGNLAFCETGLYGIDLPNSVTELSANSFLNAWQLGSVTIGTGITSIPESAFSGTSLSEITWHDNITSIGKKAFAYCEFKSLSLPANLETIAEEAFYSQSDLLWVSIPNKVKTIAKSAFEKSDKLTTVYLGSGLTSIDAYSFYSNAVTEVRCSAATPPAITTWAFTSATRATAKLYVPSGSVETYRNADVWNTFSEIIGIDPVGLEDDGFYIDGMYYKKLDGSSNVEVMAPSSSKYADNITIPEKISWQGLSYNVTAINASAFSGCTGLTSITIPAGVATIADNTFAGCTALTKAVLSAETIGIGAFSGCAALSELSFSSNLTAIGTNAFNGCSALTTLTLPAKVATIGEGAFAGCSNIGEIWTMATEPPACGTDALKGIDRATTKLYVPVNGTAAYSAASPWNEFTISGERDTSGESVIFVGGIYYLTVNENEAAVTSSPDGYTGAIVIPSSIRYNTIDYKITAIGANAFQYDEVTSVKMPETITAIGDYAFANTDIAAMTIPNTVTTLGAGLFVSCYNLKFEDVILPDHVTEYTYDMFADCSGFTEITIPENITILGENSFNYCRNLTKVTLHANMSSIGRQAFHHCDKLTSIISCSFTPPACGENCFGWEDDMAVKTLYVPLGTRGTYKAADVWKNFGNIIESEEAGRVDGQFSVDGIYYKVTALGEVAVRRHPTDYTGDIAIPSAIEFEKIRYSVTAVADSAFYGADKLTAVTFPYTIKSIGNYAFYYCSGITQVTISDNVKTIGEYAFGDCGKLEYIHLPEGLESVGMAVFLRAPFTSITLPSTLSDIANITFLGCSNLTKIVARNTTPPACNAPFINEVYTKATLYVPIGCKAAYQAAEFWNKFGSIVESEEAGIDDVIADDSDAPAEYYNLQGAHVANPENGLYIRRQGGKAEKVYVK